MSRPGDYHALGLLPGAAPGDVREAYRELVRIWDPARFAHEGELRGMAALRLQEIRAAYLTLTSAGEATEGFASRPAELPRPARVAYVAVWWATLLVAVYLAG